MNVDALNKINGADTYPAWTEAQKRYVWRMSEIMATKVREFEVVAGKLFISFHGLLPMTIVGKRGAIRYV